MKNRDTDVEFKAIHSSGDVKKIAQTVTWKGRALSLIVIIQNNS